MLKNKIKTWLQQSNQGDNKRKIENLAVFLVVLMVTLVIINLIWSDKAENKNEEKVNDVNKKLATVEEDTSSLNMQDNLNSKLEEILAQIQGVGKVKVLITYSQTSQTVPMYNEDTSQKDTEEKDTNGGSRKVIETDVSKDVIYQESNGEKIPITQSIVSPKIEGAIITAQGANNAGVKANIIQAVEAVTGVSSHKIQVFAMVE